MNRLVVRSTALLSMLSLSIAMSACKRTEIPRATAPLAQTPANMNAPGTPSAAVPEAPPLGPATGQPAPASVITGTAAPTTGPSKGRATSHGKLPPVLRAVRSAAQPDVDRLAFEFDTDGLPAWTVEYVNKPVLNCGSGEPVKVAGEAFLQISFAGAQAHAENGKSTSGPKRRVLPQTIAHELVRTCDFEGEVTWVVGVSRPNPYTARTMSAPSRLVIDIAH